MNSAKERTERVRAAVWSLLRWAEDPRHAIATAHQQVDGRYFTETDFRATLRAAGLFARDNDGYFLRHRPVVAALPEIPPQPTHQVVFPSVVEPRMKIAYNVFAGLLLKFLYQTSGAVPVHVQEGLAQLWAPNGLPDSATAWTKFKRSEIAEDAIIEGVDAALGALGQGTTIGSMPVTPSLCDSAVWDALKKAIPRYLRKFQPQGGKVITFFEIKDIPSNSPQQNMNTSYQNYLAGQINQTDAEAAIISGLIQESLKDGMLSFKNIKQAWQRWKNASAKALPATDTQQKSRLKELENALSAYDRRYRRDAAALQKWINTRAKTDPECGNLLHSIKKMTQQMVTTVPALSEKAVGDKRKQAKKESVPLEAAIASLDKAFALEMVTFPIGKKPLEARRAAVALSLQAWLAWENSKMMTDNMLVMGLPVTVVRSLQPEDVVVLRYLAMEGNKGQAVISFTLAGKEVMTFGYTSGKQEETGHLPFVLTDLQNLASTTELLSVAAGRRCIVCGATGDLLGGQKTFLPESKKRYYEQPGTENNPDICSHCAFVAYLSSIVPQKQLSVVEFPVDDYLELFALHESLQGLSEQAALKELNRVATLSVLPSRYLLLSLNTATGKIDTKTQVYLQLKGHAHLFLKPNRPINVHVAGDQAHIWTEILPVVAIGLGYFNRLPYYTSKEGKKKGAAYDIVNALQRGLPFAALYSAVRMVQGQRDSIRERDVLKRGIVDYDTRFVRAYQLELAQAAGGQTMKEDFYEDVIALSNELFALTQSLVRGETGASGSNVSVVARKYTDLIDEQFGAGSPKLFYRLTQDADAAERNGDAWTKGRIFTALYGEPTPKGMGADLAKAWDDFRERHPKIMLETRLSELRAKHGAKSQEWATFLSEVRLRLLSLLLLNVRSVQKQK